MLHVCLLVVGMTGRRELVHVNESPFIDGYRWQRSGLGVAAPPVGGTTGRVGDDARWC